MGLLSSIGSIAGAIFGGPTGGAIGGTVGSIFDDEGEYNPPQQYTPTPNYWPTVQSALNTIDPYMPNLTGVASAYAGYQGQQTANETNIGLARENNAFNATQAEINRDWQERQSYTQYQRADSSAQAQMRFQERMANTAYQRATQDLQAAGLNPMLAYQQGGAASPGGAAASASSGGGAQATGQRATVENAIAPAINSGNIAARVAQELESGRIQNENQRKTGNQIDAQTDLIKASIPKVQQETITSQFSAAHMNQQTANLIDQIKLIREQVKHVTAQIENTKSDTVRNTLISTRLIPAQTELLEAQAKLSTLQLPGAGNEAGWQTQIGGDKYNVLRGLDAIRANIPILNLGGGSSAFSWRHH